MVIKDKYNAKIVQCFKFLHAPQDLNLKENVFQLVRKKLPKDAIDHDITKESFRELSQYFKKTIKEFPVDIIDRAIASMNKRIN